MPVKTIVTGNQTDAFLPRRGKLGAGAVDQGAGNAPAAGARLNIHRTDVRRKVGSPVKIVGNHAQTADRAGSIEHDKPFGTP